MSDKSNWHNAKLVTSWAESEELKAQGWQDITSEAIEWSLPDGRRLCHILAPPIPTLVEQLRTDAHYLCSTDPSGILEMLAADEILRLEGECKRLKAFERNSNLAQALAGRWTSCKGVADKEALVKELRPSLNDLAKHMGLLT